MDHLIDDFFGDTINKPMLGTLYGKYRESNLWWQRKGINEKIPEFINYLSDKGIYTNGFRKYDSPIVGSLSLIQHTNTDQ